jgi:glutamate racemase
MPLADFVYVADTARAPYGRKPPETIAEFAREIASFLCGLRADGIIAACHTVSATGLQELQDRLAIPVWGVIDAAVSEATRATRTGSVGVIASKATALLRIRRWRSANQRRTFAHCR